jgi:hypothetical protein
MIQLVPVTLREANSFVAAVHRHHKPVRGCKAVVGIEDREGVLRGVGILGRPVGRLVDRRRAEVTRVATDGVKNGCSMLYGACARAAAALGYWSVQTFVLASESGRSLEAAGWTYDGMTDGGSWNRPSRGGRREDQPQERKRRYVKVVV